MQLAKSYTLTLTKTIPSLNGLRAISILMVIAGHLKTARFFPDIKLIRYLGMFFFNGQLAVNIFFIISGFLITTLLLEEKKITGTNDLKKFYIRRALRILPAYYFFILVLILLSLIKYIHISSLSVFSILTLTKQFFPNGPYEMNHLWSLSVEEFFYLIWPFIFSRVKNKIILLLYFLISLMIFLRIFEFAFPNPYLGNTIFSIGDALMIGCLVAISYSKVILFVTRIRKYIYLLLLSLISSVVLSAFCFHLIDKTNNTNSNLFLLESLLYGFAGNIGVVSNILIAIMIVYSINIDSKWHNFLNLPFMDHIGRLSYSIYLWQELFTSDNSLTHELPFLLLLLLIYLSARFSYSVIEKPFLNLKVKYVITRPLVNGNS